MIENYEFTIVKDTREQKGWDFEPFTDGMYKCNGVIHKKLDTGDYSIENFTDTFVIERKRNTAELYGNIFEKRFEKEWIRLESFKYAFLICEFDLQDILYFPVNSGLPSYLFHKFNNKADYLISSFLRYTCNYKTKIIFAGKHGKSISLKLFKWIAKYGTP